MRILSRALAALALAFTALATTSPTATSVDTFCADLSGDGLTANEWQGLGVGPGTTAEWENAANWSLGHAPLTNDEPNDYVCIPAGGLPVIANGEEAHVSVLDVEGGATLELAEGAKLFVESATRPSQVRSGGTLRVIAAGFGGPAKVNVLGTLVWRSLNTGAASIMTRECSVYPPACPGPVVGDPGEIEVGDSGLVAIDGRGVNLKDEYRFVVRGTVRLTNQGYIAADRGTAFELRPKLADAGGGLFDIRNNGGYYEGMTLFGVTSMSSFVNQGTIKKSVSTGVSVIDGAYSRLSPGSVEVLSGTLTLPAGSTTAALVRGGRSYGSGRCLTGALGCQPTTFADDRMFGRLTVPTADTAGASVVIREEATKVRAADISPPIVAHATGMLESRSALARITLRFDERLLSGRGWRKVNVFRKASPSAPWVKLPACRTSDGRPPVGSPACVDRRGLAGSSRNVFDLEGPGSNPDVIMVVRTTKTSRWVGR